MACLSLSVVAGVEPAAATGTGSVPSPTVEGPITPSSGISFVGSTLFAPSSVGYEQSEFFLSGKATSYTSATPLTKNGRWKVKPATAAAYKTRVVVYRPIDPKRFNGTVVVEWLNVTAGIDAPAAWLNAHVQMIRDGMAYVGVDAQAGGINGDANSIATSYGAGGLRQSDPARYGSLQHPGDSYSYSIYQQAGQAVHTSASQLLGGLHPKRVLALGESQSAFRMVTYINALQPQSPGIYDGYFVYSRGGNSSDLSQAPQATVTTPTPTYIRTDVHVPVFLFETETDLLELGYLVARQPSTPYIREWETAGTSHDDTYGLLYARSDTGTGVADTDAFQSMSDPPANPIPGIVDCAAPVNAGSHTYELRAAVAATNHWLASGTAPRSPAPRGRPEQSPRLPDRRQRQRPWWNPYTAGRGPRGQALRCRSARVHFDRHATEQCLHHLECHALQHPRHDGPVHRDAAVHPVSDPRRLRGPVGCRHGRRGQGGLSPPRRCPDP